MDEKTFLVVDIGTQSLRASLVDQNGRVVRMEREVYEDSVIPDREGYFEQWPDFYWNHMVRALKRVTFSKEFQENPPVGMTCCDFRDTACYLDSNLKPIRPSILWLDSRNAKLEKDNNLGFFSKLIFSVIGMMKTARANGKRTIAQWLKENEPETWNKVYKYVPLGAYINLKLVGQLLVSSADCNGHFPIDFKRGKWYSTKNIRWNVFGIDKDKLCPLVKVGSVIGRISASCAQETGLPEGFPVYASASDKACEVLGNGCLTPDVCTVSYGTACTIDQTVSKYKDSEPFLPAYQSPVPGLYDMEVQIYRGFWMLRWFADNFANGDEKRIAEEEGISIEAVFDRYLEQVRPGSDGLLIQPYWGAGLSRPDGRGAMVGFSDIHDRRHIYRALIEGISYALKEGLETIQKRSGHRAKKLVISGGGSRSDEIQRITADVFNLPVVRAETTESCTVGAAIGGFIASGVYTNAEEAVSRMVRYSKKVDPNHETHRIYQNYYRTYKELYPQLKRIDSRLKSLSSESERR